MRTVLAAAAAGALIMGSAAGVMAAPKEKPAPAPVVKLQSISIKGHKTIDLAKVDGASALTLRASVRDTKNAVPPGSTIAVALGVYDKKVSGTQVPGTDTIVPTILSLKTSTESKNWKRFTGSAVLATVWSTDQIGFLKTTLKPGDKAYACIKDAVPSFEVTKYSMQTKKRLADASPDDGVQLVKRPVRDCVKVIDSTPEES